MVICHFCSGVVEGRVVWIEEKYCANCAIYETLRCKRYSLSNRAILLLDCTFLESRTARVVTMAQNCSVPSVFDRISQ